MARSALIVAESGKDARGRFLAGVQWKRRRQILQTAFRRGEVPGRPQAVEWARGGERSEHRHGASAIGHLDGLPSLDPTQQLAGSLPQLSHSDTGHVLVVAHYGLNAKLVPTIAGDLPLGGGRRDAGHGCSP